MRTTAFFPHQALLVHVRTFPAYSCIGGLEHQPRKKSCGFSFCVRQFSYKNCRVECLKFALLRHVLIQLTINNALIKHWLNLSCCLHSNCTHLLPKSCSSPLKMNHCLVTCPSFCPLLFSVLYFCFTVTDRGDIS